MVNNRQQHQVAAGTGLHSSGGGRRDGRTYISADPDSRASERGWGVLAMEITARGKAEFRTNTCANESEKNN
jgi:hypothetical protein